MLPADRWNGDKRYRLIFLGMNFSFEIKRSLKSRLISNLKQKKKSKKKKFSAQENKSAPDVEKIAWLSDLLSVAFQLLFPLA